MSPARTFPENTNNKSSKKNKKQQKQQQLPLANDDVTINEEDQQEEEEEYVCTLSEELKEFARKELGETEETRRSGLRTLRSWLRSKPHLRSVRTDNNFLLRFLRSQKFNLEKAQRVLEKYIQIREDTPEWFKNLDPTDPTIAKLIDSGFVFVLPDRDSCGRRVVVNYPDAYDIDLFTNNDIMKIFMATLEYLLQDEENQIRGFTYIFYCRGMTLAHCGMWTGGEAAKAFRICEKNLPMRHQDMNLVHLSFGLWAVIEFVKQLLSAKLKGRIFSLADDDKMAEKFDHSMLPQEFGGMTPLSEMTLAWRLELQRNKAELLSLDEMKVEEQEMTEADKNLAEARKKKLESGSSLWNMIPGLRS